jgi:hypothetical protein
VKRGVVSKSEVRFFAKTDITHKKITSPIIGISLAYILPKHKNSLI